MTKTIIIIAVVIVIGIGIYILLNNNSNTTPSAPVSNTPTPPVASDVTTISIKNFSFNPSTMTIKTGAKVTWINDDTVSHTVTSDSGNLLNSGTISPGQSFSFTFTSAGSINYHCNIHPMMKGSIVVGN